jgi:hypothetical protein
LTGAGKGLIGLISQLLAPSDDQTLYGFPNPSLTGDPGGLQGATPSTSAPSTGFAGHDDFGPETAPLSIDDEVEVTPPTVADAPAPDNTTPDSVLSTQDAPSLDEAPGILASLAAVNIDGNSPLLLSVLASAQKDDDMALLAAALRLAESAGIQVEEALQLITQQSTQGSEMHA